MTLASIRAGFQRRRLFSGCALTLLLLSLSLTLGACQTTREARSVEPSGFLGDYSMLRPGRSADAVRVFIAPGV